MSAFDPQPKDWARTWLIAILAVVCFFLLIHAVEGGDAPAPEIVADEQELTHALELREEIARIARDAHAQGAREVLASVQGTEQGEAFERSCARLWNGQHP